MNNYRQVVPRRTPPEVEFDWVPSLTPSCNLGLVYLLM